jgi:hypothetical protein
MNKRFWMVLGPQGMPVVRHYSEAEARKEAERLARANSGQEFVVLRSVSACVKSDIRWQECDEQAVEVQPYSHC